MITFCCYLLCSFVITYYLLWEQMLQRPLGLSCSGFTDPTSDFAHPMQVVPSPPSWAAQCGPDQDLIDGCAVPKAGKAFCLSVTCTCASHFAHSWVDFSQCTENCVWHSCNRHKASSRFPISMFPLCVSKSSVIW